MNVLCGCRGICGNDRLCTDDAYWGLIGVLTFTWCIYWEGVLIVGLGELGCNGLFFQVVLSKLGKLQPLLVDLRVMLQWDLYLDLELRVLPGDPRVPIQPILHQFLLLGKLLDHSLTHQNLQSRMDLGLDQELLDQLLLLDQLDQFSQLPLSLPPLLLVLMGLDLDLGIEA